MMLSILFAWAAAAASQPAIDVQAAVGRCITPAERRMRTQDVPPARRRAALVCMIREVAGQINAQAPTRLNDVTTLQSVTAADTVVTYTYRMDLPASQFPPAHVARVEATLRQDTCATQQSRAIITLGGTLAYLWLDPSGRRIHSFRIDRC